MANPKDIYKDKKILVMTPVSTGFGGAEIMAANYARYFAEQGAESILCFEQGESASPLGEYCDQMGVRHLHPKIAQRRLVQRLRGNVRSLASLLFSACLFFLRQKPDAIQIVLPSPEYGLHLLLAARIMRIPANVRFALVAKKYNTSIAAKVSLLYRWAFRGKQVWNALSEDNRRLIGEIYGVETSRVELVYNAYFPRGGIVSGPPVDFYQQFGLKENCRVLLCVGRLAAQKGCRLVMEILLPLFRKYDDVALVWVGDGELREEVETFISAGPSIRCNAVFPRCRPVSFPDIL
jgi:glycosyltransferase involved in cell wall biosynthesis